MTSKNTIRLTRRAITTGALGAIALSLAGPLHAQSNANGYPSRPVMLIVPTAAGGTTDIAARMLGVPLGTALGQTIVVDNKGGANGAIAAVAVKRAEPDGYTLLMQYSGYHVITPLVSKQPPQWQMSDLTPVANVLSAPQIVVIRADLPIKNMAELIAYAKANPGKLNYSSTGVGTSSHLSGFMLTERIGAQATHIPYKGADALNDLLTGRVQFMFATIPSVMAHIQAGKLRAIAVSSGKRSRSMPDVPTVAEKGFPGFEAGSWFGIFAPKGTPQAVITKVNQAVNEALPSLQAQMIREGADPVGGSAEQFGKFTQKEYVKWKDVVRASGASVD